eukprot:TRINITY_DN50909_c0_g1_i1.p2 TRINITY_DN50909_c0_g1~~TRINITY_DN50909_c0_g1_i1.p2  ORF type:complete len:109 (+),score=7.57 TRINITY_DN50909_c0_g1_i1:410-736(+)
MCEPVCTDSDIWYHRLALKWAGHVARMRQYDDGRLTYKLLRYRHWEWIQNVAVSNKCRQKHGKRLRIWRWERPVYKCCHGQVWQELAQDKTDSNGRLDEMMTWRRNNR